jgi:hypothetical protein
MAGDFVMSSDRRPAPYAARPNQGFAGRDSGPSYNQVLEEIRNAGMISTDTTVEVSPTAANEYLCVIKAEVMMPPLREGDPYRKYTGMGAAYPRKNAANVVHGVSNPAFYMHIAESRAKKRAWMDALGRGDGLEENVRQEVFAERARNNDIRTAASSGGAVTPALPVPSAQDNEIVSEEIAKRISTLGEVSIEETRLYTKSQAASFFTQLNAKIASQRT